MAYPTAPSDVRETLAKEQFMDSLVSSELRIRIKQARPKDLNDAVRHAVELEAYNRAERKQLEGEGYLRASSENMPESKTLNDSSQMAKDIESLKKIVSDLTSAVKGSETRHFPDINFQMQTNRCPVDPFLGAKPDASVSSVDLTDICNTIAHIIDIQITDHKVTRHLRNRISMMTAPERQCII